MTICEQFLVAYAKSTEWPERKPEAIMRRLCLERYCPKDYYGIIRIAYGWMWGKTGNETAATCYAGLLKFKLGEVYQAVAKEYQWE